MDKLFGGKTWSAPPTASPAFMPVQDRWFVGCMTSRIGNSISCPAFVVFWEDDLLVTGHFNVSNYNLFVGDYVMFRINREKGHILDKFGMR